MSLDISRRFPVGAIDRVEKLGDEKLFRRKDTFLNIPRRFPADTVNRVADTDRMWLSIARTRRVSGHHEPSSSACGTGGANPLIGTQVQCPFHHTFTYTTISSVPSPKALLCLLRACDYTRALKKKNMQRSVHAISCKGTYEIRDLRNLLR